MVDDGYGNDFSSAYNLGTLAQTETARNGLIEVAYDVDFFKFTVPVSGIYTIRTTGTTDTIGQLYDNNTAAISGEIDDQSDQNSIITVFLTSNSSYYLKVSGNLNFTGAYTLSITMPDATIWYEMTIGNKTVYIKEPESDTSSIEARVCESGSSVALLYNYIGDQWISNNTYAYIPGSGGAGAASVGQSGDVSSLNILNDVVIKLNAKINQVKQNLLNSLGYDPVIMTSEDWDMITLGITAGVIDSSFPEPDFKKPKTLVFNKYTIQLLIFKATGVSLSEADANYYYINSKTQTEYAIMIGSRFASAASYTAAVAALKTAGISFEGGVAVFAGSGGLGAPVTIVMEVGAATALVASGVCALAGLSLSKVAITSQNCFDADYNKLSKVTPPKKFIPHEWWDKVETGKTMDQILLDNNWTKKLTLKRGAYQTWDIYDWKGAIVGRYDKGHTAFDYNVGKNRTTASHYHIKADVPEGIGNMHYITTD
jgi:hypothetical protein